VNVQKVTPTGDGVSAECNGRIFEGRYLIAADGLNSRIAEMLGFNKGRTYYCQLRALMYYLAGVEPPQPRNVVTAFSPTKDGPIFMFLCPKHPEGEFIHLIFTLGSRLGIQEASDFFTKKAFTAPWYRKARVLRTFSAHENCYSPIVEAYKDRVFVAGDVGATQEIEITGAIISGWKAGHAASLAIQEENLGLEVTAPAKFADWWKQAYANYYNPEIYMKGFALPLILTDPADIDYVFSLIKEPLRPGFHPYSSALAEQLQKITPIIQEERPDILKKMQMGGLPFREIVAEVAKDDMPVF
jgi:flavin-dependent dehydrogenase